jgi:hypothetical protein
MSGVGEEHGDSCSLCRSDYLFVSHTSTWLHDCYDPGSYKNF